MLDLVNETAISLPFRLDARGNVVRTTDLTKIWGDRVRAAVGTIRGERLFNPTYGSNVPNLTLEPMRSIEQMVREDVAAIFVSELPLLHLKEVVTTVNSDEGTLYVDVYYELPTKDVVNTQIGFATINGAGPITEMPL